MSRIPYLDRLGDAFEEALARPVRSQRRPWVAAIAGFCGVLLVGGLWWLLSPTSGTPVAGATTTTVALGDASLPVTWARVPSVGVAGGSLTLSGIAAVGDGFVAVGTEVVASVPTGVVFESTDGIEWTEAFRADGASLHDVTTGPDAAVAVGLLDGAPIAVVSAPGGEWNLVRVAATAPDLIAQANAVAAFAGGFIAVGTATETSQDDPMAIDMRPLVWTSADGRIWRSVSSFGARAEIGVGDVATDGRRLVIAGLVGDGDGRSDAVVWTSDDGADWREIALPSGRGEGFSGVSQVANGPGGWVAVGFDPSGAAVWTSEDATSWRLVDDPALGTLGSRSDERANGVVATSAGYTVVGFRSDLPRFRHVFWTSPDGRTWQRYDLTDPAAEEASTIAFAAAATDDRIVAVGSAANLAGSASVAAIWVSPAPPQLVAGVPLVDEPTSAGDDELVVAADPVRASAGSSVWIRGRVAAADAGFGDIGVWLVGEDAIIPVCDAALQGRNFMCRVTPVDLIPAPAPGSYRIAVGDPAAPTDATLEIVPDDVDVLAIGGRYSRYQWPLVHTIVVSNKGGSPVDLGGWTVGDSRVSSSVYVLPADAVLPAGQSLVIEFPLVQGASCPESTTLHIYWCRVLGHGDRVQSWDESDHLWQGGDIELRDRDGEIAAVWSPGG